MTELSERPTSPTPEGRALAAFDKCYDADPAEQPIEFYIAAEIRAAEQAARKQVDDAWWGWLTHGKEPPAAAKTVREEIIKSARRAALEEIAAHVEAERTRLDKQAIDLKLSGSKDLWHRVRGSAIELRCLLDWLRARAKENND